MSNSNITLKVDPQRIQEMPLVDLAFEVLRAANTPFYYRDLVIEIAKLRGLSQDDVNGYIAQLYTEINIDGRFACVGSNTWGLKRWYPVERSEDPLSNSKRTRIINDDDDDEEDLFVDEEENYAADEEEYDAYDTEREGFDDADEDEAVDEDAAIDEEELDEEVEGIIEEDDDEFSEDEEEDSDLIDEEEQD